MKPSRPGRAVVHLVPAHEQAGRLEARVERRRGAGEAKSLVRAVGEPQQVDSATRLVDGERALDPEQDGRRPAVRAQLARIPLRTGRRVVGVHRRAVLHCEHPAAKKCDHLSSTDVPGAEHPAAEGEEADDAGRSHCDDSSAVDGRGHAALPAEEAAYGARVVVLRTRAPRRLPRQNEPRIARAVVAPVVERESDRVSVPDEAPEIVAALLVALCRGDALRPTVADVGCHQLDRVVRVARLGTGPGETTAG